MQTPNFDVNQTVKVASLSVEDKAMLDEMAFKTLPKMAFEVEFYFQQWQQMPVNWRVLATGYLIGKGKSPQEAVELVKRIFDYANKQGDDHWSRQQYSATGTAPINEAISLRGVGDTPESER